MLGGIVIVLLISIGSNVASDIPRVLALGAATALASVVALLPPWHRLPRVWLISVAVGDILIVAVLERALFASQSGLSILALIPTLWLAFSFGLPGVIVAVLSDYFVALLPYALSGAWPPSPDDWGHAVLIPAIVSGVGVAVYITARHIQKQRDALSRANDELKEAVDSRDEFLRTISHELRTPLTSMIGYLEVIEDSIDLEKEGIDLPFGIIHRNSERLLSLINALISEAHGRPAPTRRSESVVDLATKALDAVRPAAAIAGVTVSSGNLDRVSAELDAADITEVFDELLSNAVKFTHRGGAVSLSVTHDADDVVIRILDSGIGIAGEDRPHIFERFFRGSAARRAVIAGTGLGLATVKTIVDSHAGRIGATSVQPHGTAVEVRLPLVVPGSTRVVRSKRLTA
jgi:signal transduction histidine kinase